MNAEVNRRVFVASVAAGLPALASAAHGRGASSGGGHGHAAAAADADAVLDHVVRELAVIHNRGKQRAFTGEDARAIAAQLRTAAVRSGQIGIDATAKKGVQHLIRSRGRNAVQSMGIDTGKMKARLKPYGIDVDERWLDARGLEARPLDDKARHEAIEALVDGGISGVLMHAAGMFENIGNSLDGVAAGVRRVQLDPAWYSFCWGLLVEIQMLIATAGAVCGAASLYPDLDVACGTMEAALSAYLGIFYAYCT
jgi:hypothetical protein